MDLLSSKHPPWIYQDPQRLSDVASWHEHIPFAFALVHLLEPKVFVELGTHKGDSFLAFCQAILTSGITCASFAVDTWVGEEHAGFYAGDVFADLKAYHDPLYGAFSTLIRSTFDEALGKFGTGSIDLLHIDGLHTYEAVRHDFDAWLPKMGAAAIVLLHDTNARERDFGVWKLWEEVSCTYPSFEFMHGHGLGVIAVGSTIPIGLQGLFSAGADEVTLLRRCYSLLGSRIAFQSRLVEAQREKDRAIAEKDRVIAEKDLFIRSIQNSLSWKMTRPLRSLRDFFSRHDS